ncbi:MAG: AraC family transcriptional regulator [Oligosphaeraceae bacterium]
MHPDQLVNPCVTYEHVIPEPMRQIFLPLYLKHPSILRLRHAGVAMGGISHATPGFRIDRLPSFHFLALTLDGTGEMTLGDVTHALTPGTAILVPADTRQRYRHTGNAPWRFCWFHLDSDTALLPERPALPHRVVTLAPRQLEDAIRGLALETMNIVEHLAATTDERPPWQFYCDSMNLANALDAFDLKPDLSSENSDRLIELYADTLLMLLDRHLKHIVRPPAEKSSERRLLEELWLQVGDSLRRKWTLPLMAAKACMSVSTLLRQTKRHYDATPMQILYHLRLKHAAKLLLSSPQLPISMVALHCGYDNFAAFSTAFRKEYGTSPRLFRNGQNTAN